MIKKTINVIRIEKEIKTRKKDIKVTCKIIAKTFAVFA